MASTGSLPKKILIFGATGTIGQYILQELYAARSSFDKIGIFTSTNTARNKADEINAWKEKGIDIIIGDVTSEQDIKQAYSDYDTVISALGRTAILAQLPLITLASSLPTIKFFYPSEYGTDIEYAASSAHEAPHQNKLKVRKYIRESGADLKVTYLVTGPYSDLYFGLSPDAAAGSFDVKARKATLLGNGDEKISFTTERDVGRLLVAALKTPVMAKERVLRVNSFTVSSREVVAEFEKQTGAKWDVRYTSVDELKKAEEKAWEEDSPFKTVYTLRRIWIEGGTLYEKRDNGVIGKEEGLEGVEEQVRKAIEKQM